MLVRDGARADGFKRSFPDGRPFNPTTSSSLGLESESGKENSLPHKPSPEVHDLPQVSPTPGTRGQEFHFSRGSHGSSDRLRKPPSELLAGWPCLLLPRMVLINCWATKPGRKKFVSPKILSSARRIRLVSK